MSHTLLGANSLPKVRIVRVKKGLLC